MRTSAEVLEFEALRRLLGRYMASPLGKRELEKVQPHADRERLTLDLAEAGEAVQYLHLATHPQPAGRGAAIRVAFGGLADVQPAVQKLRIEGAGLEPKEIFELFTLLDVASESRQKLPRFIDLSGIASQVARVVERDRAASGPTPAQAARELFDEN